MANRNTLALSKIDDFKSWLLANGWEIVECKGLYEILRARHPNRSKPLIVYKRDSATVHATVQDSDFKIIRQFLRETRGD